MVHQFTFLAEAQFESCGSRVQHTVWSEFVHRVQEGSMCTLNQVVSMLDNLCALQFGALLLDSSCKSSTRYKIHLPKNVNRPITAKQKFFECVAS